MSTAKDLTLAYLRMHPTEAARVLEQLPFAETAVLRTRAWCGSCGVSRLPPRRQC